MTKLSNNYLLIDQLSLTQYLKFIQSIRNKIIKSNSFLSKQIIKSIVILGVQLVILTSIFFSGFGLYSAQADTSIPPVKNSQKSPATEQVKAKAESAVEEGTENIVKKLNLDEPVPAETEKFFRQIQGKEPIENERIPEVNR